MTVSILSDQPDPHPEGGGSSAFIAAWERYVQARRRYVGRRLPDKGESGTVALWKRVPLSRS